MAEDFFSGSLSKTAGNADHYLGFGHQFHLELGQENNHVCQHIGNRFN